MIKLGTIHNVSSVGFRMDNELLTEFKADALIHISTDNEGVVDNYVIPLIGVQKQSIKFTGDYIYSSDTWISKKNVRPGLILSTVTEVNCQVDHESDVESFHTRKLTVTTAEGGTAFWELYCNGAWQK